MDFFYTNRGTTVVTNSATWNTTITCPTLGTNVILYEEIHEDLE